MYAGIDSSTQSTKVLVVDDDGRIVRSGRASHPDGTEVDPAFWWEALREAISQAGGIADCAAVSIAGQQHGLVMLDADGEVIRPSLLWNDTRSASSATDLIAEESVNYWVEACGSAPVASLTVSKVRWIADNEPDSLARLAAICLPHDWLTWKLSGSTSISDLVTDRSDASGTGYVDCRTGEYRYDLLAKALHWPEEQAQALVLPRIAGPFEVVGTVAPEFGSAVIAPGCGDNAGAALGLGLAPGQASVSLGTSGVVATVADRPVIDPAGEVTGFMDATGNWLPLACTLNGSRIIDYVKDLLGVTYAEIDELAAASEPSELVLVPYFEGERTPNLPYSTARMSGMTPETMTPGAFSRAAIEGMCCLMRGAFEALIRGGARIDSAMLIGGGAKSEVVQRFMANILGVELRVPEPGEYVALGAARQAALVVDPEIPAWTREMTRIQPADDAGAWGRYREAASRING